jgi:hypothetical protein
VVKPAVAGAVVKPAVAVAVAVAVGRSADRPIGRS